jgi:hypothetical protein
MQKNMLQYLKSTVAIFRKILQHRKLTVATFKNILQSISNRLLQHPKKTCCNILIDSCNIKKHIATF